MLKPEDDGHVLTLGGAGVEIENEDGQSLSIVLHDSCSSHYLFEVTPDEAHRFALALLAAVLEMAPIADLCSSCGGIGGEHADYCRRDNKI